MRKVLALVVALVLSLVISMPINAGDDIPLDGHAACQACLESNYNEFQQCEAVFGEGDADCRARYSQGVSSCQLQYCNQ